MDYEKVSVNIDNRKLSTIDFLVEKGFYANRSDFINQSVQKLLDSEQKVINDLLNQDSIDAAIINDNVWFIGVSCFGKEYLTRILDLKKKINVRGFGVLTFDKDCDDDLIFSTIETVSGKIKINASETVRNHYAKN